MLAGTTKPAAPPLNRAQAFLEAQDDVATRRFVVRKNPCLLHMVMLLRQQHFGHFSVDYHMSHLVKEAAS